MENKIQHTRGDTLIITWVVKADWVAMNITGCDIKFTMRKGTDKTKYPVIVQKTANIDDAVNGKYTINVPASEMNLSADTYSFDIQLTDSLEQVTTIALWTISIQNDIT